MTMRLTSAILAATALAVAAPAAAQAATRTVKLGLPSAAQRTFNETYLSDVNDYFPHRVTIHAGDRVRFVPTGFHSMDLPRRGGKALHLFAPTGGTIASLADAAGSPFWFDGRDELGINPRLLDDAFASGKRFTYDGRRRLESGVALAAGDQPITVKFPRRGSFRFLCDVHPGMHGVVDVVGERARIPSARKVARAVGRQVARDVAIAKRLARTEPPAGDVYAGASGRHGVEYYAMLPASTTVAAGTTLRFRMSPGSYDDHTVTFGPGDPENEPGSYLGQIAASFGGPVPDQRAIYPSEPPGATASLTPTTHGNGFWGTGALDTSGATPQPASGAVTFTTPGTFDFYCMIHPFMHGTVVVR